MSQPVDTPDRVKRIIADVLCVDIEKVTDEADLHDDLGADSLDDVAIVMALEDELEIDIPDEEMLGAETVDDLVRIVRGRVKS